MDTVRFLERPDELHALAHPLRIRLLSHLQHQGPATASILARTLGESTGATSFHLRQLARYGLIREGAKRANGRERWWEASARHYDIADGLLGSPEHEAAASLLLARVVEHDAAVVSAYLANRDRYPEPWRDRATLTNHVVYVTPAEHEKLSRRLREAFAEHERSDPADRPPNAMRVYGVLRLVPWDDGHVDPPAAEP